MIMILETPLEVKLYSRESVELPSILKDRLPRIQFIYQPRNIKDIQWIFSLSGKNKIPVIPRGAATSGIGCIAPLRQSVMVDLTHLNRILDLDEKNKTICFEAGLRWWDLKRFLKGHSLDLFTYPTSLFSTVGGWLSTGGYGINSFRYGHVSNLVDSIEIAFPGRNRWVSRKDREFKYIFGTEGQTGIISKVKLRVREAKPSKSHLVFFNTTAEAFNFLSALFQSKKIHPGHVSYFDRHRLEDKNLLLKGKAFFPRSEGILLSFEDTLSEPAFLKLVEEKGGMPAEDYLTAFLWNERFFPFSMKHFHPSLLGCETLLPLERLNLYLTRTRIFGRNHGLQLSTEATFINRNEAVVFTIFPSDPRRLTHFLHLFLTYSLTQTAVNCGGRPYGIGLWNLPLLKRKFSNESLKDFRHFKKEIDPQNLINPAKSLSADYRVLCFLKFAYSASALFSKINLLKPFSKIMNHKHSPKKRPIAETEACLNCGACVAVCPSCLINRTEMVAAKGKLFLLKKLLDGSSIPEALAEKTFLCLHCHLCEYVCQSKLTLNPVWDKLESIIEKKFGRPKEKIEEFIKQVESDPAYSQLLDSLSASSGNSQRIEQNV